MVRRNVQVPMYQPRIPIGGGGRVLDLTEDPRAPNPIADAINLIIERKRQREQDEINRRKTEAEITKMGREKPRQGIFIMVDDKTLLIDPVTGETITEIPKPPESYRKISEERAKFPPPTEFLRTQERPTMRRELAEAQKPTARKRKRVVSKAVTKERPPKPKEYPDAKWSEEHQMWTIVKNGRLMGVK